MSNQMASDAKTVVKTGGVSATSLLGVLFVGLKLTGYIDWSWWWVTLPFWGPLAIFLAVLSVILAGAGAVLGAACVVAWASEVSARR
jgi:hypothetical protein